MGLIEYQKILSEYARPSAKYGPKGADYTQAETDLLLKVCHAKNFERIYHYLEPRWDTMDLEEKRIALQSICYLFARECKLPTPTLILDNLNYGEKFSGLGTSIRADSIDAADLISDDDKMKSLGIDYSSGLIRFDRDWLKIMSLNTAINVISHEYSHQDQNALESLPISAFKNKNLRLSQVLFNENLKHYQYGRKTKIEAYRQQPVEDSAYAIGDTIEKEVQKLSTFSQNIYSFMKIENGYTPSFFHLAFIAMRQAMDALELKKIGQDWGRMKLETRQHAAIKIYELFCQQSHLPNVKQDFEAKQDRFSYDSNSQHMTIQSNAANLAKSSFYEFTRTVITNISFYTRYRLVELPENTITTPHFKRDYQRFKKDFTHGISKETWDETKYLQDSITSSVPPQSHKLNKHFSKF